MEINIQKALNDKLYDKRKAGALEYVFSPSAPSICCPPPELPPLDADLSQQT